MGYSKFKSVHIGSNVSIGNNNVISNSNIGSGGSIIDANERLVILNGKRIPFHPNMTGNDIIQVDNHIIIDGYKLIDNKWVSLHEEPKSIIMTVARSWQEHRLTEKRKSPWQKFMNWLKGG